MSYTDPTSTDPQSRGSSGRIALIVAGAVIVLVALLPLGAGAALLGAHASERDDDGYYASGASRLSTQTRAFVSEGLDFGGNGAHWLFDEGRIGTLRVTASGTAEQPVFVGIARKAEVDAYLHGVDRAEVTDFDVDPFEVTTEHHAGTAVPAAPGKQAFWDGAASGPGEQTVEWPVEEGDWAVVVMNADGSPDVRADVSVGAKLGWVVWLGAGLAIAGALLLAGGIVALVAGTRRPRGPRPAAPLVTAMPAEGV